MRGLALRVALVGVVALCLPATAHAVWNSAIAGDTATMASAGNGLLVIDHNGAAGLLRHNQAGNGFNSTVDFDNVIPGDQTVLNDNTKTVVANGDGGVDTTQVGSATVPASQVQAAFTFDGNGGSDAFTLANQADSSNRSYAVGPSQIAGYGTGGVTYSDTEALVLNGGTANDDFGIQPGTPSLIDVNGGTGDDTVNLGDGVQVPDYDGGADTDTLSFAGWTTPFTFTLGAPTSNVENLTGGSAGDTITGNEGPNRVDGGPGADTMRGAGASDFLAAADGTADTEINCGDGPADVANVDAGLDPAPIGCETVNQVSDVKPDNPPGGGNDTDGDGVPDAGDACPTVAGPASNNGCPPVSDRDGDGTADAQDRCPDASGTSNGCPEVERKLTILRKEGDYRGKLETTPDTRACEESEKVTVFRKKKGDDQKVGNDRTNGKGVYEVDGSARDGKYYAQVKETDEAPAAICLAAKSKNLKQG